MPTRPSPRSERLGTPNTPAIRFTRGPLFEASLVRHCYGLSGCSPPWTDLTGFRRPPGAVYIQASDGSVALPVAGYDYNSNWTPLLAGLSPAGMAASLAAPDPGRRPEHYLQGRCCALTAHAERGSPIWYRPLNEGPVIGTALDD